MAPTGGARDDAFTPSGLSGHAAAPATTFPVWTPPGQRALALPADEPAAFYARLFGRRETDAAALPNDDAYPLGFMPERWFMVGFRVVRR